jgi:hypothetical protein
MLSCSLRVFWIKQEEEKEENLNFTKECLFETIQRIWVGESEQDWFQTGFKAEAGEKIAGRSDVAEIFIISSI